MQIGQFIWLKNDIYSIFSRKTYFTPRYFITANEFPSSLFQNQLNMYVLLASEYHNICTRASM